MDDKQDIRTNPNLVEALGYYIKNKRLQKNIGLREMADMLNISPAYLSKLEAGKHTMTNPLLLKKISKVLEVDHLKLYKIIGYTDKDVLELKEELINEIVEEYANKEIGGIVKDLLKLSSNKILRVRQFIEKIK
ncbi:helix-turn-helix domain-containing protein [Leptotrichia sp. oral taxon 847]|uniref:helix-turn-helix domain-containing protein n=1 Tax=Leptotrichia sp. oral taxon 847 TaxID=1785996 RepID=UPI000768402E|nr:helix-turn-helix domain-containing protein [Leptotrichia sp. oral taxon 847]AMD95301.1 XRE family transcriptional regulator [Leptotrichia sp. oral taxon 847]